MLESIGGRRFIMTIGCGVVSTVLVCFGKISGGEFVTLVTLTIVPYIGFNTHAKIKGAKE
jgi:hypothetical protein